MVNYLNGYGKEKCGHCRLRRTKQGHDGCIGELEGVMNACCGHGEESTAYVQFNHFDYENDPNKHLIKGREALAYIREHSIVGIT